MVCSVEDNGLYDLFLKLYMSAMKVVWHSSELIEICYFHTASFFVYDFSHKGTTISSFEVI